MAKFGLFYLDSTEVWFEGSKGWTRIGGSLPSARAGLRMVRSGITTKNDDRYYKDWLIATGELKM